MIALNDVVLGHSLATSTDECLSVALQRVMLQRAGGRQRDWYFNLRIVCKNAGAIGLARCSSPRYGDLGAVWLFVGWERNSDWPISDQSTLAVGFGLKVVRSVNCLRNWHSNLTMICNQGSVQGDLLFRNKPIIQSKVRYWSKTRSQTYLPNFRFD